MAAIDIRTQLVIDQIHLDNKAKSDLAAIKANFMAKLPAGLTPPQRANEEAKFDKAAREQGLNRGEKAQPTNFQKIGLAMMTPATTAMKGLTAVLEVGLKNSKIVQTVTKKIGEALGLLVDLILLPFLPILIWGIINLFKAVLWLGDIWKNMIKQLGMPLSLTILAGAALLAFLSAKVISATVDLAIAKASMALYAWLMAGGAGTLITAGVNFVVGAIAGLVGLVGTFILWLEGLFAAGGVSAVLGITIAVALGAAVGAVMVWFLQLFGVFTAISDLGKSFRDHAAEWFNSLPGPIQKVVEGLQFVLGLLANIINLIPGMNILTKEKMSGMIASGTFSPEVLKNLRGKYGETEAGYSGGKYTVGGKEVMEFAEGGMVPGTGAKLAVLHGGETVLPPGKGGITLNFYGYQDDAFIRKVRDIIRSDATRYSQ